jgi:hypothetical protein
MMPPEGPNNKSEELLQRYAKERREQGGDFSLHPATRRVLQGEVARQFKKPAAEEKSGWWVWLALWRGRLAVGGAVAAAVVLACWVYWDNSKSRRMEMAQASTPPERDEAFGRRELAERSAKLDVLSDRLAVATEAKKEAEAVKEKLAVVEEKRKQQPMPVDEFGTVASFYSVVPATNNSSLSLQLGDQVDYLAGTVVSTNVSSVSRGYSAAGFGVNYAQSQSTNAVAQPQPLTADYAFRVNAGEPVQNLAVVDRADGAQAASRLMEPGKPAANAPLDSLSRGRNESVANLGAAFTTTPSPARPASPAAPVPAEMPPAATPPPAATAFGGAALAAAPTASAVPEALSRRSRDEARYYRVAPTGVTAGRDVAPQSTLAKAAENSPANFRVLARFAIEQQTNTVRLLDSDGSVYEGTLSTPSAQPTVEFAEADKDAYDRQKVVTLKRESEARSQEYSFRAAGSNVTLRQIVEVSGRFAPGTNGTNVVAAPGLAANGAVTAARPERRFVVPGQAAGGRAGGLPGAAPAGPAVIDGTVRVGRGTAERFRALPETK